MEKKQVIFDFMHILIVTPHFWPENFRINDFAMEFVKKGYKITVLTATPDYPDGKIYEGYGFFKRVHEIWNGVSIYRAPTIPRGNGSKWRLFINYFSYVISASLFVLYIKNNNFDIIFVYEPSPITVGLPAILLKRIKKIPLIFWVLDLWPESVSAAGNLKSHFIPNLLLPLVRFIYYNSNYILVSSKGFISSIVSHGISKKKILYFPNWAEEIFNSSLPNNKPFVDKFPDGFIVLFAGNIGEAQDFESILKAAELIKNNKDIHWVILGDGRKADFVKTQIKQRKIDENFHVMGKFPLESMPFFFSKANILLVSLKDEFIFSITVPGKLQSYLASGRPVLTMLSGEGSKIIEEANAGFTANAGDFNLLAKNIEKAYNMEQIELKKLGINGFNYYIENFERSMLFKKAEDIFHSCIQQNISE